MPDPENDFATEQVDLTNCDREPIHIIGHVQDFGCLIAVSADWLITHASVNCVDILGHPVVDLIGCLFSNVFPRETVHVLRTRLQVLSFQEGAARVFAQDLFGDGRKFDVAISKSGQHFIFEIERCRSAAADIIDQTTVRALIGRIQRHGSIERQAVEAARGLKLISGFERVMVYRFNSDDSGEVIAEEKAPDMEPFLGLRYPASDIPKQARALYTKNLIRLIADVDGKIHPIEPPKDPTGSPLDLTYSVTRAVSPIHLEYLRNMGVAASMSVSILRKGKLWGLLACHHRKPRYIDYATRSLVELFAQFFNYELSQIELNRELEEVDRARNLHDQLMARLSGGQGIADAFDVCAEEINAVIPFDGAAVFSDGEYRMVGSAPTKEEFMGLARFLNTAPAGQVYATHSLARQYAPASDFVDRVAGLLALPISRTPRDYLVLFRKEVAASVTWAGSPEKPVEVGPNGQRLTPRKSFDAWTEVVRGQCAPWREGELRAADALRTTLLEVVIKMADERNSVRKKAQDQQELLIAELNHRVRNILNLIRGLVSQGNESAMTVEEYRSVIDARIFALSRAHDQLTRTEWDWVSLRTLVETEVNAFLLEKASRVRIGGDEIELSPTAFTTLALVVHELVTNSAKYGALSDSSGSVSIEIGLRQDGNAVLAWREHDGPPVQAPTRRGFGTTIIERSIPFELKGEADVRFRITGFEADFVLPASHMRPARADAGSAQLPVGKSVPGVSLSGNCLVLDDNMVIALDTSDMLKELGAPYVAMASNVPDALDVVESQTLELAVLDVNLGDHTSVPVVERCLELSIPVILATGYGTNTDLVEKFPSLSILKKPYSNTHLRMVLSEVLGG